MSKTPMTDEQIAILLTAPLSDEARKILYERALAFDEIPNFPKADTVYTAEQLADRDRMKRMMDMVALSKGKPVQWDNLQAALDAKFPKNGIPPG